MAQVVLNWLYQKHSVASMIVGATKAAQAEESLGVCTNPFPYYMFADGHQAHIHGQINVAVQPVAPGIFGAYRHCRPRNGECTAVTR